MAYKTILANAEAAPRATHIAAAAARLAAAHQAHLVGVASSGINPLMYQCNAAAPGVAPRQEDLDALTAAARQALAAFSAAATALGASSCEERLTHDALTDSLIRQARYCDLLVLGQADPDRSPDATLPHPLILHSPRPALVIPYAGQFEHIGARPLLAWDGGMAASRAILAALPLLRRAMLSTVAVFNPTEAYDAHGALPGADLAAYLARHGIKLDIVVRDTDGDVGAALLSLAADLDADLLVMGCYGHTRLRELLLGGATRSVLDNMTVPVLMSA